MFFHCREEQLKVKASHYVSLKSAFECRYKGIRGNSHMKERGGDNTTKMVRPWITQMDKSVLSHKIVMRVFAGFWKAGSTRRGEHGCCGAL